MTITKITVEKVGEIAPFGRDPQLHAEPVVVDILDVTRGETTILQLGLDAAEQIRHALGTAIDEARRQIPVSTEPDPDLAYDRARDNALSPTSR